MNKLDLGAVSAYAMAKEKGYEGTEEEFATLMAESGDNALRAEAAKNRAEEILESIPLDYQEAVQGVVALSQENHTLKQSLKDAVRYYNLHNLADIVKGYTISTAGEIIPDASASYARVAVTGGADYAISVGSAINKIWFHNANGQPVASYLNSRVWDNTANIYRIPAPETATNLVYLQEDGDNQYICLFEDYDKIGGYTAGEARLAVSVDNVVGFEDGVKTEIQHLEEPIIRRDALDFIEHRVSENLLDPTGDDVISGYYFNAANGTLESTSYMAAAYVKIYNTGTFVMPVVTDYFGATMAAKIPVFDRNKTYIKTITGNLGTATNILTITIADTNVAYIGLSCRKDALPVTMVVAGSTYPDEYIPYQNEYVMMGVAVEETSGLQNPLYKKIAIFDGDSICNGGSALDGLSGWAGRIGPANNMTWVNYAIGGGTIVHVADDRYCIGENIETIYAKHPKLDYLILEGGTNDADLIGADRIGTFDEDNYAGGYDTTTFTGALETLFRKAVTYFPHAKIGYIVAHKMGASDSVRRQFFVRAMEVCKKWGIPYIDLWTESHINNSLIAHRDYRLTPEESIAAGKLYVDAQHLAPAGYEIVTPKIEAWMRTL